MFWPDPVAFYVGSRPIYWYGLSYLLGFIFGFTRSFFCEYRRRLMSTIQLIDWMIYLIIGLMIGSRLGSVIFYYRDLMFDPISIIYHGKGGMSFHGGLIGLLISIYIFSKRNNINPLDMYDLAAKSAPVGIFLGRLANFINQEMPGRVTDVSWGIIYPKVDVLTRHPSQLYEAFFEGFVLFVLINLWDRKHECSSGTRAVVFCLLYTVMRFLLEFFRQPDLGYLSLGLTIAQWLSIAMFFLAIMWYVFYIREPDAKLPY
ncbi:MAG TPA: prolipoprotein diacylglyceryl transferase [Gammaproteobacteria bacterium]|nr:prolipoprotein diacylglyceryl transferase [Gammaproteobacteria bacterium]